MFGAGEREGGDDDDDGRGRDGGCVEDGRGVEMRRWEGRGGMMV